jgi:putative membrane protein
MVLFLKGIAMGSADVVPGVSGGTIAFITGIYEELISSIQSVNLTSLKLLREGRLKRFWEVINGRFLVVLVLGILVSIFSLAKGVTFALENYPIHLWSFFFGLILISAVVVLRNINRWTIGKGALMITGAIFAFFLTSITPATSPDSLLFVFISGLIAICAMILPGISGSFILVILGKYEYILNSLKELDFAVIGVFAVGCIIGLLSFARLISWTFRKYHDFTISVLAGFMLGSLNKVWPWKEVLQYRLNSAGKQVPLFEKNISPGDYFSISGNDPYLIQAILFMAFGFFIVLAIERLASFSSKAK